MVTQRFKNTPSAIRKSQFVKNLPKLNTSFKVFRQVRLTILSLH